MSVGLLMLTFHLPNCHSLKEKRSWVKPIIARLHKEFNISVVEYDHQDVWQTCELLIALAASKDNYPQHSLEQVITFFESHWPDLLLVKDKIEIIS